MKSIVRFSVYYLMCMYVRYLQRLEEGTRSPGLELQVCVRVGTEN